MAADALVTDPGSPSPLAGGMASRRSSGRGRRVVRWLFWSALLIATALGILYELRTSALQAYLLPRYTAHVSYHVGQGPSPRIAFPRSAPFDDRLGYAQLADYQARLEARGFEVERQAVISAEMQRLHEWGIAPPYREPLVAGLSVRGMDGAPLYDATRSPRWFRGFDDVPPLLVETILFIENRELLAPEDPRANPAIEWDRMVKASLLYTGSKLGLGVGVEGGSTLAIQLEKYRHSPHGRTNSPLDKLRQVAGASLKAYRDGADTREWRREIVVDYLNTAPLAAAPGYGEIYGLGDGLYAWFGLDLASLAPAMREAEATPAKARAYKHALALLIGLRAPTHYLHRDRLALSQRLNEYTRLLMQAGVIDPELAGLVLQTPLEFLDRAPVAPPLPFAHQKAPNAIRTTLLQWLGLPSFYELDRLHLEAEGTIDVPLQGAVERLFADLGDEKFVRANGLTGQRLLRNADPAQVIYSLMLFERTPQGNLLRVNADNLDRPFDINNGVKLDLGSTAKLRTLAHYLEVIALLHAELAGQDGAALGARARAADTDPLTAFVAAALAKQPDLSLAALLDQALARKYPSHTGETFFTGGGQHTFTNFTRGNAGPMPVGTALKVSNNLVFIRVMRDLVRYHRARLPYDAEAVLKDADHPQRARLLTEMADEEARQVLSRAFHRYRGLTPDAAVDRLLGSRASSPRHLAMCFFAWGLGRTPEALQAWLRTLDVTVDLDTARRLTRGVGGEHLGLLDYGYLLGRQPLEVWTVGELVREPGTNWAALLERSAPAREQVSRWLFQPKAKRAQRLRLRIKIEREAFARMTPHWQRLGFPFDRLVPSYATAIGSSSDRPAALAVLMGIIANDGVRKPTHRLTRLHWGAGTPYETVMVPRRNDGERVLPVEVAQALRATLGTVVAGGTAGRLAGAFKDADGTPIAAGGKTGSGDNRFKTFGRGGIVKSSRVVSRTATFAFYVGDRYYGVLTAFVPGKEAGGYEFTSALSVQVLRLLAPALNARLAGESLPGVPDDAGLAAARAGAAHDDG